MMPSPAAVPQSLPKIAPAAKVNQSRPYPALGCRNVLFWLPY